jgi:hypothetical protein
MSIAVELIARRIEDLSDGHPDYLVYAGKQRVGRIYRTHFDSTAEGWFWGVNGVTVDVTVGAVMHDYASSPSGCEADIPQIVPRFRFEAARMAYGF